MIPKGWHSALLGQDAEVLSGQHILAEDCTEAQTQYPYLTGPADFPSGRIVATKYVREPKVICNPGDILITVKGSGTGKLALANQAYCISRQLAAIRPRTWNRSFVFHVLSSQQQRFQAEAAGFIPGLGREDLLGLPVLLPPILEQRKIAEILSSIDDAIQTTQAVIDQLGVVKKALMAELLTRGIPGRHTKFKQTDVGEIPADWDYRLLDSVAQRGSGHTPSKNHPEYWDGDIKWVSLKDSSKLDRLYISDTAACITDLGIANSSAVRHPPGTVVLSRDAGVGKSAIMTEAMAVSQHFMAWVCGPQLDSHFLYYLLQFRKPAFERIAIGNTIKTIGLPYFKALKVPLPPLAEQKIISTALKEIDSRIFDEEEFLEREAKLKAALMSALLTGELRVPLDKDPP